MFAPCAAPRVGRGIARSSRACTVAARMTMTREVVVARRQLRRPLSAAYRQFGPCADGGFLDQPACRRSPGRARGNRKARHNRPMQAQDLERLVSVTMPFGKYKGRLIADLPGNYLNWFAREGFPRGELGRLLALMHEMDHNGLKGLLEPLRERG